MNEDIIRHEIQEGLSQVDSSFVVTSFEITNDPETPRKIHIAFTATNAVGEEVSGEVSYD